MIKKIGKEKKEFEVTDWKGIYKLKGIKEYETYNIAISAEGYNSKEITIKGFDFDERKISKEILLIKKETTLVRDERIIRLGEVSGIASKPVMYILDNVLSSNDNVNKLNPDNIESYEVLQGAEAIVKYGADASEGAIIITTKKELAKPTYKLLDTVSVKSELQTKRKTLTGACTQISGEMLSTVTVTRTYTDVINKITTKISGTLKLLPTPYKKATP
ncbi:MAG: hypothetical protein WDM90_23565 [Ferruginibacter sp.]